MTQFLKAFLFSTGLLFSTFVAAQTTSTSQSQTPNPFPMQPVLHQITFNVNAEQWVTTQNADVQVGVDATLNQNQLATAHTDIMDKLNKLANGEWHIIQFNRTQNSSGLEQLNVVAQARLPETALSKMRDDAKAITHPGETFTVLSIAFNPSTDELEAVRAQLRNTLYGKIQDELNRVNKIYTNQKYVVHEIDFSEQGAPIQPQAVRMTMMAGAAQNEAAPEAAAPLTVANKLVMTGAVTLVSVEKP